LDYYAITDVLREIAGVFSGMRSSAYDPSPFCNPRSKNKSRISDYRMPKLLKSPTIANRISESNSMVTSILILTAPSHSKKDQEILSDVRVRALHVSHKLQTVQFIHWACR
jgi:hypothetical protein